MAKEVCACLAGSQFITQVSIWNSYNRQEVAFAQCQALTAGKKQPACTMGKNLGYSVPACTRWREKNEALSQN